MSKLVAPMQSIDTVHRSALAYIPFQIAAARAVPASLHPDPPPIKSLLRSLQTIVVW